MPILSIFQIKDTRNTVSSNRVWTKPNRDDWERGTGKHETILQEGVEKARLENAGPSYRWVENVRDPSLYEVYVAMGRLNWSYQV